MRWLVATLLLVVAAGCEDSSPPPGPPNQRMDAGARDAGGTGVDAQVMASDGGGAASDGGVRDAGHGRDADVGEDAGELRFPPDDPCDGVTPPGCGGGCEPGFACVPGVCGGMECVVGRPCFEMNPECSTGGESMGEFDAATIPDAGVADPLDAGENECENTCGESIACIATDTGESYCQASDSGCISSSECPLGFACESGGCVDRRVPCGIVFEGCPRGYVCSSALRRGPAFCVPAQPRCESSAQCEMGASCVDVDGDGSMECQYAGVCETNADCPSPGAVCGVHPQTTATLCLADGPCTSAADCGEGYTCVDLAGAGTNRCERTEGGSCNGNEDCPENQVCASAREVDPVRCLGRGMGL